MVKFSFAAILALFFLCMRTRAQDGSPDLSFDGDGRVVTVFEGWSSLVRDLVIQPDGKIIAGGFVRQDGDYSGKFGLVRYNPNGSLDDTFGTGGKSVVGFEGVTLELGAVILLPDRKIIAVGRSSDPITSSANVILVRFTSDGHLDTSFGVGGKVTKGVNSDSFEIESCKLQNDGKIVVGGTVYDYSDPDVIPIDLFLLRFDGNGNMDSLFGTDGMVTTSVRYQDELEAIAIQNDGRIVCTGAATTEYDPLTGDFMRDFFAVRYKHDGELDSSFGDNGKVIIEGSEIYDRALVVKCQDDGKIVLAGISSYFGPEKYFMVVHLLNNGELDSTFGNNGVKFTDLRYGDLTAVEIQDDGRIVAAEYHGTGGCCSADIKLLRFLRTGDIDSGFGNRGVVTLDFMNAVSQAYVIAVQSDGKIVIGGASGIQMHMDFALARFNASTLAVHQNEMYNDGMVIFPNPVKETANLNCNLSHSEVLSVDLYDNSGRWISNLLKDQNFLAGFNSQKLDFPENLASGIYFLKVSSENVTKNFRIVKK